MGEQDGKNGGAAPDPRREREAKLAQALRANLRRRKAAGAETELPPTENPEKSDD